LITGIPGHYINDIELKNIKLYFKGGGSKEILANNVPELEKEYPEPASFGVLPAYGFFIRHAQNVKLEDIDIRYLNEDKRAAIILQDVQGAELKFIKAAKVTGLPLLLLKDSKNITLHQSFNVADKLFSNAVNDEL